LPGGCGFGGSTELLNTLA